MKIRRLISCMSSMLAAFFVALGAAAPALAITEATAVPATGDIIMKYLPWIIGIVVLAVILIVASIVIRRRGNNYVRGKHSK
jgi:choline-glycine betaine transporter